VSYGLLPTSVRMFHLRLNQIFWLLLVNKLIENVTSTYLQTKIYTEGGVYVGEPWAEQMAGIIGLNSRANNVNYNEIKYQDLY
jgi:hypothetical protein